MSVILNLEDLSTAGSQTDISIKGLKRHATLVSNLVSLQFNCFKTVLFQMTSGVTSRQGKRIAREMPEETTLSFSVLGISLRCGERNVTSVCTRLWSLSERPSVKSQINKAPLEIGLGKCEFYPHDS